MQYCRFCQKELKPGTSVCPHCGQTQPHQLADAPTQPAIVRTSSPLPTAALHCPRCGTEIPAHARFCPVCGQPVPPVAQGMTSARATGAEEVPGDAAEAQVLPFGYQAATHSLSPVPAGPQMGAPQVPGAPALPQAGAPSVPSAAASPQSGMPSTPHSVATHVAGRGLAQTVRAKLLEAMGAKVMTIVAAAVVLGATATGVYAFTRPQPTIQVISDYHVNKTSAGAAATVFVIRGQQFSANSIITFLLDSRAVPGNQPRESDGDGTVEADLLVTDQWGLGQHILTAKDDHGYVTKQGIPILLVTPGQANTPGPNGAPPDTASFKVKLLITFARGGQAEEILTIANGTICRPDFATGKPQTATLTYYQDGTNWVLGTAPRDYTATCQGTYHSGKLTYTETLTSDTWHVFDGGYCVGKTPYRFQFTQGMFTGPITSSGTFHQDGEQFTCPKVVTYSVRPSQSVDATWTGSITTSS